MMMSSPVHQTYAPYLPVRGIALSTHTPLRVQGGLVFVYLNIG
jgi:hypothetical protein